MPTVDSHVPLTYTSRSSGRVLMCSLMIVAVLSAVAVRPASQISHAAGIWPTGLPGYVGLGLANSPGSIGWMTESAIPWNYRYQYLAGGANTGHGWATWNPNGDFATYYMEDSDARGYIPIFTYYQLLQSAPATGASESERTFTNLNHAATMHAYLGDFKLLLDKVRAFGKPVILHLEPDLFGYMHQRAVDDTNSAASISVKVAASGHPEAVGLPDTFQGFNWALLRMRDRYAPNVLMAAHVSHWSTKVDIGTSTSTTLDVPGIAQRTAAFHNSAGIAGNPAGISSYDLLFFDPSYRDAAYYQHVWDDGGAHWWDVTNHRFPNFNRYDQYIKGVTDGTNWLVMLWQIPIGNTLMRSQNNTPGHYQDNRVQYWLGEYPDDGHMQALANANVHGLLFGPGAGQQSTYADSANDGITNPTPINGNALVSTVPNDDGGFLRTVAARYYQRGPWPITLPHSSPPPLVVMKSKTFVPSVTR